MLSIHGINQNSINEWNSNHETSDPYRRYEFQVKWGKGFAEGRGFGTNDGLIVNMTHFNILLIQYHDITFARQIS